MQCEEFEGRLNQILDERRRPEWDAELRLHCEACVECRQLAADYDVLLDGFYALAKPPATADLAARVLADVQVERRARRPLAYTAAALAIAGGLLIAVLNMPRPVETATAPVTTKQSTTGQSTQSTDNIVPAINVVAAKSDSTSKEAEPSKGPTVKGPTVKGPIAKQSPLTALPIVPPLFGANRNSGRDPYADLIKQTGNSLASFVLFVPGIGGRRGIIDFKDHPPSAEPNWAVQMSDGLKPVTDSVGETFDLLLKAFPVTDLVSRS